VTLVRPVLALPGAASGGDVTTEQQKSCNVTVTYPRTGFLQPVNTDGTWVFKAGSTIPVKFALSGAAGPITDATATLWFTKLTANVEGTYLAGISTAAAPPAPCSAPTAASTSSTGRPRASRRAPTGSGPTSVTG
jgi:hypothetical protein